jgi:hypothetical protein
MDQLRVEGRLTEAEAIRKALELLYANDPEADAFRDRLKAKN